MNDSHQTCIDACNACATACDHCSVACLQEPDPKPMARCIELDMDCAQACRLAAAFMSRGSNNDVAACAFCASLCEACAAECGKHPMDHCRACAEACRRCATECTRMSQRRPQTSASSATHERH